MCAALVKRATAGRPVQVQKGAAENLTVDLTVEGLLLPKRAGFVGVERGIRRARADWRGRGEVATRLSSYQ